MSVPTENFRSPAALSRFFLTTVIGLTFDLWTKVYAFSKLALPVGTDGAGITDISRPISYDLIPGWLRFQLMNNHGAVFGIGQGQRWLFVLVSLLAIVFLTYLFATSGRQRFYQFVLGMLLAGVLGNMYDRIVFGYVRDMIYALPQWHVFPWIFNVADSLLCMGVVLMIVYSFLRSGDPKPAKSQQRLEPARP